ncbi:hypothetical protein [Priestia megaterium]|uniref:hypothetical protein n=1 Tax=Priestia megaterium TaxID=1404 RepID=UPI000BFD4424|nr:hypothetical protein [Priestia megaterium]PGQ88352.1 hypothetical protein COA18_05325 [Priestia megaterium]
MEQTVQVCPSRSTDEIKELIDTSTALDHNQKNILRFLLDTENSWLHFSFDQDWDLTYSQNKIIFVQDLIKNSSWKLDDIGECMLNDVCYMIVLEFKEALPISSLYEDQRSRRDNRESFQKFEIYLTKHDLQGPSKHLLAVTENLKEWLDGNEKEKKVTLDVAATVLYETFIFLRQYYALPAEVIGANSAFNKFLFSIVDDLHNVPSDLRARSVDAINYHLIILRENLDSYLDNVSCQHEVVEPVRWYIDRIKESLNKLPKEAGDIPC